MPQKARYPKSLYEAFSTIAESSYQLLSASKPLLPYVLKRNKLRRALTPRNILWKGGGKKLVQNKLLPWGGSLLVRAIPPLLPIVMLNVNVSTKKGARFQITGGSSVPLPRPRPIEVPPPRRTRAKADAGRAAPAAAPRADAPPVPTAPQP
ncbi:MAG: hypothetical protein GX585_04110 [Clostridiales bacterium]|nr:hypothetical protein [Clostridiales bacterium]